MTSTEEGQPQAKIPSQTDDARMTVEEGAEAPEDTKTEKRSSKENVIGATAPAAANGSVEGTKHVAMSSPPSSSEDITIEKKPEEKKEEPPKRTAIKNNLIVFSLCMAVFLAALDTTIITTAVPTIAERFKVDAGDYTWVGSAYLLAAAAATPTWGKLSDIWGRKVILLLANFVFFIGSLIAALSINIKMLIAGRVIQGIGGGGLISLSNICISDLFSMRERGKYFGMIGATWGLASAVGPVLGGVFTEKVSWRWCFYINLPFDGLAFLIILFFLDIEIPKTPIFEGLKAIDWIGVITSTGGTIMFLLGLEYGGVTFPWSSATVVCLIVFGLVTIALFFLNEWKLAHYPVMPLRIFKDQSNIASLGVCFFHGFVFISGAYYLPLYFQAVLGASPILSGVYLFPFVISLSFVSMFAGIFIKKTGQYLPPIWFGLFFMTLGFGLYIDIPSTRTWGRIFPFQIIAGIGVGPNFQSPLIALQSWVQPRDIATATATFGFTRNIATSVSVVIGGVIFQNRMAAQRDTLVKAVGPEFGNVLAGGGATGATQLVGRLPPAQKAVVADVYTKSLRTMWIFYVCMAAAGLATSFLIKKKTLSKTHEVQKTGLAEEKKYRAEEKRRSQQRKSGELDRIINSEKQAKDEEAATKSPEATNS